MDMEVDSMESNNPQVTVESAPSTPDRSEKERILDLLDQVELHVERLRQDAYRLEEEKDGLLSTLAALKDSEMLMSLSEDERSDVLRYAERVSSRCLSVEVPVKTDRDCNQEESLHEVNRMIDTLVMQQHKDLSGTRMRCISYINACSSSIEQDVTDKAFEGAIMGCAVDDKKRIKKRLQGLLHYFDKPT